MVPFAFRQTAPPELTQGPQTDLSSFLVQLRQLFLMLDSHLRHFLLQSVAATRACAQAERRKEDTSVGELEDKPEGVGAPPSVPLPLCSKLDIYFLNDAAPEHTRGFY